MTDSPSPGRIDALERARDAFGRGDYAAALAHYDYFFEHALDEDFGLYGVRLSYCLNEWAELGEQFPEALARLQHKKEAALRQLESSRDPEKFHDYVAICDYLKCPAESLQTFLTYHRSDRDLARSVVHFIWDALVASENWAVCGCYLDDGLPEYDEALIRFDEAMQICDADPSLGGEEFAEQIEGWYVREVTNLVQVLHNTARRAEADAILQRVERDCTERKRLQLLGALHAELAP